jgi:HlyD family secretion protein
VGGIVTLVGLPRLPAIRDDSPPEARAPRPLQPRIVAAPGRVEPREEIDLGSRMPGLLKEVRVGEGDRVGQGDIVAVLDCEELEAAVDLARASLEWAKAKLAEIEAGPRREEIEIAKLEVVRAKADLELSEIELARQEGLMRSQTTTKERLDAARTCNDRARAALAVAEQRLAMLLAGAREEERLQARAEVSQREADLRRAQALLDATFIRSPIGGVVVRRYLDPGESITPELGIPVLRLADTSLIRVRAEVDDSDIGRLAVGLPARVTAPAYPGAVFHGRVAEVGLEMGQKRVFTREPTEMVDRKVVDVLVDLEAQARRLPLHLVVDVEIELTRDGIALANPRAAE